MPEFEIPKYSPPQIDILRLQAQLKNAGLPITNVRIAKDITIDYDWTQVPDEKQFQQAAEIVANHNMNDKTVVPDVSLADKIAKLETDVKGIKP